MNEKSYTFKESIFFEAGEKNESNVYLYFTNANNTTLYIGVTNDLKRRISEHKSGLFKSAFTARYNLTKLVYFECYEDELTAIAREKYLKKAFRKEKSHATRERSERV